MLSAMRHMRLACGGIQFLGRPLLPTDLPVDPTRTMTSRTRRVAHARVHFNLDPLALIVCVDCRRYRLAPKWRLGENYIARRSPCFHPFPRDWLALAYLARLSACECIRAPCKTPIGFTATTPSSFRGSLLSGISGPWAELLGDLSKPMLRACRARASRSAEFGELDTTCHHVLHDPAMLETSLPAVVGIEKAYRTLVAQRLFRVYTLRREHRRRRLHLLPCLWCWPWGLPELLGRVFVPRSCAHQEKLSTNGVAAKYRRILPFCTTTRTLKNK